MPCNPGDTTSPRAIFLSVRGSALGDGLCNIATAQDVALYGTLCCIAKTERKTLNEELAESSPFRETLDYLPIARDICLDFRECRFGRAVKQLNSIRPYLSRDIYCCPVLQQLLHTIHAQALAHFLRPFTSIRLGTIETEFGGTPKYLRGLAMDLIDSEQIAMRYDGVSDVLTAKKRDCNVVADTAELVASVENTANECIDRLTLVMHNMVLHAPPRHC
eukprot:Polyplicarium_translucidae@DN3081_c0_g1_i2.p1